MTDQFPVFANAIRTRFNQISKKDNLFVVNTNGDDLYEHYLDSFPEGTNPIFRERTHHDCSCCKNFIRSVGNVVAIENGSLVSIWNITMLPDIYQAVAFAMHEFVSCHKIKDVFLTKERKFGTEHNFELINDIPHKWSHFSLEIPKEFYSSDVDTRKGMLRTNYEMLLRGVKELKQDALRDVLSLIKENNLYRGVEHRQAIEKFLALKLKLEKYSNMEMMAWQHVHDMSSRFKNTVIGTLVEDISKGTNLEEAVKKYESKVAPANYKRTKSLITKTMITNAMETLDSLGLRDAIDRRHATTSDLSINSVLYIDNASRKDLSDGLEALLIEQVQPKPFNKDRAEEISIEAFLHNVVPNTTAMTAYISNENLRNMMSLTAPVKQDAKSLFTWENGIAWSYEEGTDSSIKDKVKKAGGRVENVSMRVSLAWFNFDDLDISIREPNQNTISYANKCDKLDVDMNVGANGSRQAVENIRWIKKPVNGKYSVYVNNYTYREAIDFGFEIEIEQDGILHNLSFNQIVRQKEKVHVCDIIMKTGVPAEIQIVDQRVSGRSSSKEYWNIKTNTLVPVKSIILSPNHWNENKPHGNKHWFFILNECKNPNPVRGIYSEFLTQELQTHRKVFEILGDKTKCPVVEEQLSGVGFSSTIPNNLIVQVTGPKLNKIYDVKFGKTA